MRIYPRQLNKRFGLLLPDTYQMLPEEGRRVKRPKRCINYNQDEDSPNNTTHTNIPEIGQVLVECEW